MDEFFYSGQGNKWKRIGIQKRSGFCIPLFSVHSSTSTGIGDFNDIGHLVALCKTINSSIIQLLPLNITGPDNCPYNAISSFAIDPVYISLSLFSYARFKCPNSLISELRLHFPAGKNNRCNYAIRKQKLIFLHEVFNKNLDTIMSDNQFALFAKKNKYWLDEFTIYRVLKSIHNDAAWYEWEDCFAKAQQEKIEYICRIYQKEILFEKWIQYVCYQQLISVKHYANKQGILLMGDLPVLVSKDSADVWAKSELFDLHYSAGAPPDMYCAYGQRWGMPIQNWDAVRSSNFRYLIEKLTYMDHFFDMLRIDHVIGLFRIWAIPVEEPIENQGINGVFIPSDEKIWNLQGEEILSVMNQHSSCLLCAEDLGIIPFTCPITLKKLGIPGYEVQRWKKHYGTDYSFIPCAEYRQLAIAALSTHDTSFWIEWWKHQAGTIEKELFELKCRVLNL
ncbi:MAG TPA: 4-alpha-glucanotransferase, partial [bacterium]|nr:4-alpha-glucanotransferase [bacterium]